MIWLLCFIIALVIVVDLVLILLWKDEKSCDQHLDTELPNISVLVAARNEERNIEECLQSLIAQDYPPDKLQLLVGDDDSTDKTYETAQEVLKTRENSEIVRVQVSINHQKGKANVLSQLAKKATGDYFFITDADMQLPSSWIKTMLSQFNKETGIVTGVTSVSNSGNQCIDWLFALGMVKVFHDYDYPVTTMGNNMVISKNAYEAVGGYDTIPFSITEDFELFRQVTKKNFKVKQLYCKEALGKSKPMDRFFALVEQRKRWMQGAVQLPWPMVALLFIQASYFPTLLVIIYLLPFLGIILFLLKFILQSIFINKCLRTLQLKFSIIKMIKYELYSWTLSLVAAIYFFIPLKVSWKGRKY